MSGAVYCATQMTHIHNTLLRGLNSILRQAPYIADASKQSYVEQDVKDLLFFVLAWCKTLLHHHDSEETTFFPLVEEMTGIIGLMDDLEVDHEEFHEGVLALRMYAEQLADKPLQYRWTTMKRKINSFAPALVNHLHAEIDFLLCMEKFGGEGLKRCWLESEIIGTKFEDPSDLSDVIPFILGNCDKTYEGGIRYSEVHKPVRYAVKYWYSKKHQGAWRFNSCDFAGRPQPLHFLPENSI